ncbi:MAG: chloride channel protein, partial [Lachnospiraceae bacterium]|nr:chloride channel protein [Lachnospiraceae bacterium]
KTGSVLKKNFKNPYIRAAAGGAIILVITLLLGTRDYMGAGVPIIERAMEGEVRPEAFLLKMILTAITLGCGFKGGEIVPSFFVGATFGAWFGQMIGMPMDLCAACGMAAVFCGVTNCPISTLFISFEMFGFEGMLYYVIAVAVSYMVSGYTGLYHSQKIMYSKVTTECIDRKAR